MKTHSLTRRVGLLTAAILTLAATSVRAADTTQPADDVATELKALKTRIAELEAKQNENWLTAERTEQIKKIVKDVLVDARKRGEINSGLDYGYKDGFFIQTPDKNYKLVVGGYAQVRYEFGYANVNHRDTTLHGTAVPTHDPGNSNGFDIRRARLSFSGNVLTPDLTFKIEGDFYGGGNPAIASTSTSPNGAAATNGTASTSFFTVTDAYIAYRFSDLFRVRAGSFKVPFAKAELTPDPLTTFMERNEPLAAFDPVRAIGVSLYGELVKDKLNYEININDGGNSNTVRSDDTVTTAPNIDNRFAYYARMNWAGSGKISDFADESDTRVDNRDFVWLLGGAVGYESQTSVNNAFPSPQTTTTINGITTGGNFANYTLNGDVYRATIDYSAKYRGASFLAAAYFQQVNASPTTSTTNTPVLPGPGSSFFEHGYYGQVGYFIIPQKLEAVGRSGFLLTEGSEKHAEYYSAGLNYYVYGHNLKIQSDVTYSPESALTSAPASLVQNTQDLIFRVQLQMKF